MIACLCEDDATSLNYLWVHMDDPKRCACGYWFKLVPAKKFWEDIGYCPPYLKDWIPFPSHWIIDDNEFVDNLVPRCY